MIISKSPIELNNKSDKFNYFFIPMLLDKNNDITIKMVNIDSVFEAFNNAGKEMLKIIGTKNILFISKDIFIKLDNYYYNWIKTEGFFPYSLEESSNSKLHLYKKMQELNFNNSKCIDFYIDSITLKLIYDIKKIINKIIYDGLLKTNKDYYIYNKLIYKCQLLEKIHDFNILEKKLFSQDMHYDLNINTINKIKDSLIVFLTSKINFLHNEFYIAKQTPITIKDDTTLYYNAPSLIAVAYYRLLCTIIAKNGYNYSIPCSSRNCYNEFEKFGNISYCDKCREDGTMKKEQDHIKYVKKQFKKLKEQFKNGEITESEYIKKTSRLEY